MKLQKIAVDVAYQLHVSLGSRLLESVYQEIYTYTLREHGLAVETEVELPVIFEFKTFKSTFRIDIPIEKIFY